MDASVQPASEERATRPAGERLAADPRHPIGVGLALDASPLLRLGFRTAIEAEPDMVVVAELAVPRPGNEPWTVPAGPIDVVIAELAPLAGAAPVGEAIEAVRAGLPGARLLVVGADNEQYSVALRAGADGYLTPESDAGDVVAAIRAVVRGRTWVSAALVTRIVETYVLHRGRSATAEDAYDSLTDREREVLLLAATGHTNREIAGLCHLSERTVHHCRASVMEKLGFHDRVELLRFAIRRGVIRVADL